MKLYNVWITRYGSGAKNAGIIGDARFVRSDWSTGRLRYLPLNDGSQENFLFAAPDDDRAFMELNKLYRQAHPREARPLSGKSYMRHCRVTEVK